MTHTSIYLTQKNVLVILLLTQINVFEKLLPKIFKTKNQYPKVLKQGKMWSKKGNYNRSPTKDNNPGSVRQENFMK